MHNHASAESLKLLLSLKVSMMMENLDFVAPQFEWMLTDSCGLTATGNVSGAPPMMPVSRPSYPSLDKHIKVLESVQRRVTKRLLGLQHLPYSQRISTLGISTLSARREYLDLTE